MEKHYSNLSWQDEASCKGMDTNLFFLKPGGLLSKEIVDSCMDCPVRSECLMHALRFEEYGCWALTTPKQRVALRKKMGIKLEERVRDISLDEVNAGIELIPALTMHRVKKQKKESQPQ